MACDTRVRWALEEVGQRYEAHLVSFTELKEPAYLARHPFGQIPTYAESNLDLFETGAIVFTSLIGIRPPSSRSRRAQAITWMFAPLNTVDP